MNSITKNILNCLLPIAYCLLPIVFCLLPTSSFAQTTTTFMRTFKAAGMNGGLSLAVTSDGGFIGTGQHGTSGAGSCDVYVYKVNECGYPQWFKTYGGAEEDGGYDIQQTSDGGYIVAGLAHLGAGGYDMLLLKLNPSGNVQWSKVYGGGSNDFGLRVKQTTDGGYILTGFCTGLGFGGADVALIKTDASGNTQWKKLFGGAGEDWGDYVEQTSDGGYKVVGYTSSFGAGGFDMYVLKVSSTGNLLWSKTYGGSGGDGSSQWGLSGKVTSDGGLMICGNTTSYGAGNNDAMLIKTDSLGSLLWAKTYGGTADDQPRFALETTDKGFAISGFTTSFGAGSLDAYLIKTDSLGNLQWSKAYGGTGSDRGSMVRQTPDKGYVLSTVTSSFGADYFDPIFMRTDSLGNVGCYEANCPTIVNTITPAVGSGGSQMVSPAIEAVPAVIVNNYSPVDDFLCLHCGIVPTFTLSNTTACIGNTNYFFNTTNPGAPCTEWFVNNVSYGVHDTLPIIFTQSGIQKIQLVASCGNNTDTNTVAINILAQNAPVAAFSNTTVCKGTTTEFTDASTSTSGTINSWLWNFGDGSPANTNTNPGYVYTNPGLFSTVLTITTTFGCIDTVIHNVLVHPLPIVQFDTTIVCKGDTVQFNNLTTIASPGTIQSWAWNFGDGSPVNTTQNPSHVFSTPGTYNVKLVAVSNFGCKDSITHPLIINPSLSAVAGFGSGSLCTGGTILLGGNPTATGGQAPYTYAWTPVTGLSNPTIANPFATITASITYTVTVKDATGCQKTNTVHVTYNPNGPFADAGFGNNTMCTSGAIFLGGSPTGSGGTAPYTYSWSPVTGLSNPASANPSATITANTTYFVTVTDAGGCQTVDSVQITYNSSGLSADAGFGNNTICTGGTVLLGGAPTAAGGTAPYTYLWIPASGLNNPSSANPAATITGSTTYFVTVADFTGCQNIDSVHILFNPAGPHAEAGFGSNTICTGGTVLLGGAPSATGGAAPYTYSWLPVTGLSNPSSANPVATVTANAIYVLTITDALGCQDMDSVAVVYNTSGPYADAGFGNNTVCTGGTLLLGGAPTGSGGTPPYTYSWAPAAGLNNTTSAYPTATVTANTTYAVTVTDATGCQSIDFVSVTYNSTGPHAEAGFGNNNLCTGGSILLGGAPTAAGGAPPYFYSWLPAGGLNQINVANPIATITTNATYVVIVTDVAGCKDIDTVTLTYNSAGPHADAGSGSNAFCYGQNMTLGGAPTGSGGTLPYTYSWIPATGLNNTNVANPAAVAVISNITYYLTITDAAGCTDLDSALLLVIGTGLTANFTANPTAGLEPLPVQFTNQSAGNGLTYEWFFGDTATSLNINPNHTFHNTSSDTIVFTVILVATDVNGCKDTSTLAISVNPSSNITTYTNVFTPNGDGVNDVFNFGVHNLTIVSASIFNRWGQKMYEWSVPFAGWDGRTASGSPASNGVYFFIFNATGVEGKTYIETGYILLTR